ncbi:MAG: hypothetical protein QF436_02290 [Candidatus Woesearchaeota archaeon]|jgi:hypothetical protein|nr:hypothetical protein [Candidatus Woesearchaeota archaeon]MDP7622921.1 hypothetical protein [Candidatus Woesearchaeota archaeon]HJN56418.1 hypothetical protein [Candidatus Woesearchaeota archaeon]|tara:strand:- start:12959 stop:13348 length:390 start_codon:yes stop_codon:yes gene_type:complete
MKIIGIEFKKISIGNFFPKQNQVELNISFNDGSDKEISKTIDISTPEESAEDILTDLRKLEKSINKSENKESIIENFMNIVIKEEDEVISKTSKFIHNIGIKIEEIKGKKDAEGYLDMIRELKSLKIDF